MPQPKAGTHVAVRRWQADEWDEVDVTTFGDPVPRVISTRPSGAAVIRMARAAYVDDTLTIDAFEHIVAIAIGLEDGDLVFLMPGEVVIPLAPKTTEEHFQRLVAIEEHCAGGRLPAWAVEQWNESVEAVNAAAERRRQMRRQFESTRQVSFVEIEEQ